MRSLVHDAEAECDLVVIDTPPTSMVSDAIPLLREVSGVIVIRLEKNTRESTTHLRDQLRNLGAPTLGIVVNGMTRQGGSCGYGYEYGYGGDQWRERRCSGRGDPQDAKLGPCASPEVVNQEAAGSFV